MRGTLEIPDLTLLLLVLAIQANIVNIIVQHVALLFNPPTRYMQKLTVRFENNAYALTSSNERNSFIPPDTFRSS